MAESPNRIAPPRFPLMQLEAIRTLSELSTLPFAGPLLRRVPEGDGHPVIVCPGFMAGDRSTVLLRRFLISKGYHVYGWDLGQNLGLKTTGDGGERLAERVIDIYRHSRRKVSLVGWSLGGVMAREVAKKLPDQIRQVITLGSPIAGKPESSSIDWLYRRVTGHEPETSAALRDLIANLITPPEFVPSTSIYSKTDGIVAWQTCIEPKTPLTDNIEVYASHCGLGFNPAVYYLVADRLSLPQDEWKPFNRTASAWRRALYPSSGHDVRKAQIQNKKSRLPVTLIPKFIKPLLP